MNFLLFQELWKGGISHWSGAKIFSFLGSFLFLPPLWVIFSLPLNNKYNKTPIVKFGCHLTSHLMFIIFQILTSCVPIYPLYNRTSISPHWNEWIVCIWVSGLLLGELTSPGDRTGLGSIKIVIIFLNVIAIGIHIAAMFVNSEYWPVLVYIRNLFCGASFLCCCVQILDFLSFHYLFGPWAIIISSLMFDTGKFLTVLMLFELGFTMLVLAMNQVTILLLCYVGITSCNIFLMGYVVHIKVIPPSIQPFPSTQIYIFVYVNLP